MISNGGTFNAEWLSQQFKVMNWNILADLYATEAMYPYCEKWALSWTWRKHLILKELKSMTADIITLQEVQKDAYDDWFKPQLAEVGYEGIFQQKKREPVFHRGKYTSEGCATFYKTTRLKRVDKVVIDYDKLSISEAQRVMPDMGISEKSMQRLSKGNIALAVILEDLQIRATHGGQAMGPSGGHVLCVVNTHILCDPGSADVKLWQAYLLLQTLKQMPTKNMPLLICGDFNSTPESAVYEYMRKGCVREDHEDLRMDPCGLFKHVQLDHQLNIATAYETCSGSEAAYTNYTEDFKGTLDYIWFSSSTLAVLAISQVDDESQLAQETALPSSTRPSDHVSLVATFMFRDDAPPEPEPTRSAGRPGGQGRNQLGSGYPMGGSGVPGGHHPWMTQDGGLYGGAAALYGTQYL
jgi:CCR4-NOT transcription complex subunit 6